MKASNVSEIMKLILEFEKSEGMGNATDLLSAPDDLESLVNLADLPTPFDQNTLVKRLPLGGNDIESSIRNNWDMLGSKHSFKKGQIFAHFKNLKKAETLRFVIDDAKARSTIEWAVGRPSQTAKRMAHLPDWLASKSHIWIEFSLGAFERSMISLGAGKHAAPNDRMGVLLRADRAKTPGQHDTWALDFCYGERKGSGIFAFPRFISIEMSETVMKFDVQSGFDIINPRPRGDLVLPLPARKGPLSDHKRWCEQDAFESEYEAILRSWFVPVLSPVSVHMCKNGNEHLINQEQMETQDCLFSVYWRYLLMPFLASIAQEELAPRGAGDTLH